MSPNKRSIGDRALTVGPSSDGPLAHYRALTLWRKGPLAYAVTVSSACNAGAVRHTQRGP